MEAMPARERGATRATNRHEDGRAARGCRLHRRALVLRDGGRPREAETACREALALVRAAFGRKSSDAANVMAALARIRADRGDLMKQKLSSNLKTGSPPKAGKRKTAALKVRTHVRAGGGDCQHNETLACATRPRRSAGLKLKTHIRAGGISMQHN